MTKFFACVSLIGLQMISSLAFGQHTQIKSVTYSCAEQKIILTRMHSGLGLARVKFNYMVENGGETRYAAQAIREFNETLDLLIDSRQAAGCDN
jgi:hypothetical protein